MYILACLTVLLVTYLINTTTITVLYHRGLAHGAVALSPKTRKFTATMGVWLTGLDPKGWVCMHRQHHDFSDTADDPHSPVHYGLFGVLLGQLRSYERTLVGLAKRNPTYSDVVEDLDFPLSWVTRNGIWYLPYLVHFAVALSLGLVGGWWLLGACYFGGMMSHPVEGWIVNSLGHAVGGRNFETNDNSRNNHLAAWLILGEGFQNNHHRYPASARFSYQKWEVDLGYAVCLTLEMIGVLEIQRDSLIPRPARSTEETTLAAQIAG
ncbi:MAG: fatty-acid desaturase [Hyphomicrobiaceae bacterium]|jgi:fatty-acid desaturase